MVKELNESLKHALINRSLSIFILGSKHVAESAKARYRNNHLLVAKELNQAWYDVVLQEDNDTLVTTFVCDV